MWNILKEVRVPDHLIYLLRSLYASQETIVRTGRGKIDPFKIGKGVWQAISSPCFLFNLHAEYIMWNARLDESQARIKIVGININNLRYADDTSLIAESEEELKSLLMRVKEESEKPAWNSTFKKLRSWLPVLSVHDKQEEKKVEALTDFIFLAPKSLDGDYSHEIKRRLFLGRKVMANL